MAHYKIPGEYTMDGVTFCDDYKPYILERIKNEFVFKDDDVLLVTYPKSGMSFKLKCSIFKQSWI